MWRSLAPRAYLIAQHPDATKYNAFRLFMAQSGGSSSTIGKSSGRETPKLKRTQSFQIGHEDIKVPPKRVDRMEKKKESSNLNAPQQSNKDTKAEKAEPFNKSKPAKAESAGPRDSTGVNPDRFTIVITGAGGNLGLKAAQRLVASKESKFKLILMHHSSTRPDVSVEEAKKNGHEVEFVPCDFSKFSESWVDKFKGAHACFLFAAKNPKPDASSTDVFTTMKMTANMLEASARGDVNRVVVASSNHIMGGMLDNDEKIAANAKPVIGTHFDLPGIHMDSTLYASSKAAVEAQTRAMVQSGRLNRAIIMRIGFCQPHENKRENLPIAGQPGKQPEKDVQQQQAQSDQKSGTAGGHVADPKRVQEWWKGMYLSNQDLGRLVERCIAPDLEKNEKRIMYVNGVSRNPNSRWSLENDICYQPA